MSPRPSPPVDAVLQQIEAAFGESVPAAAGRDRVNLAERLAERTRQAKIMIIDDDPLTVEALRQFLADGGFERVIGTPRTDMALWLAQQEKPDLILLDLFMPGGNGLILLEQMRRAPELAHVPVVMVTAAVDYQAKLAALRRGATDFLNKPVHPEELIARVTNIVRATVHSELLREAERQGRLMAQRELAQAESIQMRLFPTQSR
ncbi:MAG: response regulator, partial [Planctomycetota bacterium]